MPPGDLTPPRSRSRASSVRTLGGPSRTPLPRTTSQLSTISVETRNHSSSPRKLLSKTYETGTLAPPTTSLSSSPGADLSFTSSGSSLHASTSTQSRSGSPTPSRKGKEPAFDTEEQADKDDGALKALKHLQLDAPVSATKVARNGRTRSERKYYVLTNAGKPVWVSHPGPEDTNLMGIVQALVSIFAEDDDRIRILKGPYQIAFILKAPLYLFCVSDWGEPEHVLRTHLEYIHLQILSVVSSTQLARAFQRRSNFDPSRLLEGTEAFLSSLVANCQHDFSYLTNTLQPLRMSPPVREAAAAALVPPSTSTGLLNIASSSKTRVKDLLYVLLVAVERIVTVLRPKRHSIHPSDLHLLLNTLSTSSTLRSGETFLPICFPRFNPEGFVHAYISYITPDVGLVFISADKEAYEELRMWKDLVLERLIKDKTLTRIEQCLENHHYEVTELQCPGLVHFIYKSRQLVQITMPKWPTRDEGTPDRETIITMYQTLQDSMSTRSGQSSGPLKLLYLAENGDSKEGKAAGYLGWITRPFELYLCLEPDLPKSAVVSAANTVAQWVAAEESRLFLKDAPVF